AGDQADTDGDKVGDDCDPNPTIARDRIALFATLGPGDQPFTLFEDQGTWVQRADSIELTGVPDAMGLFYGGLGLNMLLGDARIVFGLDVLDHMNNAPQNQFAVGIVPDSGPYYYVEVNEGGGVGYAEVTLWDGSTFSSPDQHLLATQVHEGPVFFQGTFVTNTSVRLDVSWPGEPYTAQMMDQVYQGGDAVQVNVNGTLVEIRYVCVITSM
ncbi:MAG TPA: hypothetical protein VL326_21365, partial [Kofleriaceae bacterium]|nr:hypothetical protein [Kofleriaceae bacterium]